MTKQGGGLDDYREVPERIIEWYSRFPDGRIIPEIVENTDTRVVVKASVFKTHEPDEPPSGVGHSYLDYPGKTNFTRGSELENAETSAVGRALVMAGIPSSYIASQFEVTMKGGEASTGASGESPTSAGSNGAASQQGGAAARAQTPAASPPSARITAEVVKAIRDLFPSPAAALQTARDALNEPNLASLKDLTNEQASVLVASVEEQRSQTSMAGAGEGYGS